MNAWGKTLMIDVRRCKPQTIRCPLHIADFSKVLESRIKMEAFGPPQIVNFGTGNKSGFTLVQLITTSNIVAHFCEETNDAYFDVFSCKDFQALDAIAVVREFFGPESLTYSERFRGEHKIPDMK